MKKIAALRTNAHRSASKLFALLLITTLGACTSAPKKSDVQRVVPPGPRVSIMSYNVENLFDTQHDEGKDDYTFMPLSAKADPQVRANCERISNNYYRQECLETDWSEAVLQKKLDRVASVIQQINDGRGPDIQILVEVENKNVLETLRTTRLQKSEYQTSVLLEGPDTRGIDTAVLSRFPQWDQPRMHVIPLKAEKSEDEFAAKHTRGILETRLVLPDGQKIAVFSLHFPSQANPSYLRKAAAEYLNKLQKDLPNDVLAIAGGDFNITTEEDEKSGHYSQILNSQWLVSHKIGCKSCEGSHYFHPRREWSFLDALLFSKSMDLATPGAKWKVDAESIRTPAASIYQLNRFGTPARFKEKDDVGVSDHLPMYAEIYKPE